MKWNAEIDNQLIELYNSGKSNVEISNVLKISVASITHRKNRLNLNYNYVYWTSEKISELKKYCENGMREAEIAKQFNVTIEAVHNQKQRFNFHSKWQELTNNEKLFVEENYPKFGLSYCAEKLGKTVDNLYYLINKTSLENFITWNFKKFRQRSYEEKYANKIFKVDHLQFINIIKPEVAYFLGYLWADGHVSTHYNKRDKLTYCFSIGIQYLDYLAIKNILESIGDFNIYEIIPKNKNWKKQAHIYTHNRFLIKYLIENDYNIKSQTTPIKILNKIPDHLKHYFFLGWFDGDGCFYKYKNKLRAEFSFFGTYEQDWSMLISYLHVMNIKGIISYIKDSKGHSSKVRFRHQRECLIFGEYIYQNKNKDGIGLDRKYNKWINFKNEYISKHPITELKN